MRNYETKCHNEILEKNTKMPNKGKQLFLTFLTQQFRKSFSESIHISIKMDFHIQYVTYFFKNESFTLASEIRDYSANLRT